ncbi:uncharacterized protein N7469_000553 [Penicillium citrinum]|uniref:DUF7580 domain-containing protein n=1 Tax=Penicillium citrinum TaxID=5077 RepID=A0A9W9PD42_PENCI|nr:uncharacterized protein N7469_000553 [Penicillium citrinum]KAJ5242226.1 hypothetical protein N7469_000553 [Penicillium citrinum]
MNQVNSQGLLKSILGFFARKPPETSTQPVSLRTQALDAWVRTDAYLQHETSDFGEVDPEQLARTLAKFENLVHYGSDRGQDHRKNVEKNVNSTTPYPKLQAVYQMIQGPKQDAYADLSPTISTSKRKRDINAVIDELSCLETEVKKRRVLPREDAEIGGGDDRKSPLANTLQEARITVKDLQKIDSKASFGAMTGVLPEFAHICQCITESLDQRNCLNLLFEDGLFKRLRPQPKTFCDSQLPRKVSLSAFFKHQQGLRGGSSVLPLKGKRILAFTLATALLPFLETPWVQPSFDHSKIDFFRPLEDGELPDITKPFLSMEQIPIISAKMKDTRKIRPELESAKHMIHPNAKSWQRDQGTARNVNSDYYTSLDLLKDLEGDAGVDYYLAAKACLQWEYLPAGELTSFESASVQRLFYQKVIKRLESEIFKSWRLRSEDLEDFDSRENELCWGVTGREFIFRETGNSKSSTESHANPVSASYQPSNLNPKTPSPLMTRKIPTRETSDFQRLSHFADASTKSLFLFDASHHMVSEQDAKLSETWMDNLLSSIYHHVDPLDTAAESHIASSQDRIPRLEPVKIAILDCGFDPKNPLLIMGDQQLDPRIKGAKSFVHGSESANIQDEIGHGTHALGLLLQTAPCAEIYIAKIADQETLVHNSYDAITKA